MKRGEKWLVNYFYPPSNEAKISLTIRFSFATMTIGNIWNLDNILYFNQIFITRTISWLLSQLIKSHFRFFTKHMNGKPWRCLQFSSAKCKRKKQLFSSIFSKKTSQNGKIGRKEKRKMIFRRKKAANIEYFVIFTPPQHKRFDTKYKMAWHCCRYELSNRTYIFFFCDNWMLNWRNTHNLSI